MKSAPILKKAYTHSVSKSPPNVRNAQKNPGPKNMPWETAKTF